MIHHTKQYFMVGVGGMVGATARYSISLLFTNNLSVFPYATLIVNLIGCFLLTFLLNYTTIKQAISVEFFNALTVGVIGSFTTFSTVSIEVVHLWKMNSLLAIAHIFTSIFGGLVCCLIGYALATKQLKGENK